mgnify:FL=1
MMKTIATAAVIVAMATTSFAGALTDPIIEAPVVVEETKGSSAGVALPLIMLVLLAAVAAD